MNPKTKPVNLFEFFNKLNSSEVKNLSKSISELAKALEKQNKLFEKNMRLEKRVLTEKLNKTSE